MANLPHLFRVDGRLHELVLHIRPWSDYGSARLGHDELAYGRRKPAAIDQVSVELGREVASLSREVTERVGRPCSNPLAVAVEEGARRLGVGRSSMLALLGSARARSVRVGGRRTVSAR